MMPSYRLYPNVELGERFQIGDFVILGEPPRGKEAGELVTVIGEDATIRSHTVIYAGNRIGARFQSGHGALVRAENTIGDDVSIGSHSVSEHHVEIGNGVRIHSQVFVPEYSRLEDGCWLGPNVVVTNALHPCCPKVKECLKGATILRGAKSVPASSPSRCDGERWPLSRRCGRRIRCATGSVVGNPARQVKHISDLDCPYDLIAHPYT